MKQTILDTSFILTCVRQKIDFFYWLKTEGIRIIIPEQTLRELEGLGAKLALRIIEKNEFILIKIPGKDADSAIINFAKKNPEAIVATLDNGLKKKIKNRKLIIRQKKKLEII
ncbi:MAG: hypothetical protein ABIH65_00620 [Nanoarchaeota archaeon]